MHRPSTAARAESSLRLHTYPFLGQRPLESTRRSEIQSWVKVRSGVLAPGSGEVVYRWVTAMFKAAVGDQLIVASPCHRIALPNREDGEVVPLITAQAATVPVVAPSPCALVGSRTANRRSTVRRTARESPTPVPGFFRGRPRSVPPWQIDPQASAEHALERITRDTLSS